MAVKADLDNISTEDLYKVAALAEGYEEVPVDIDTFINDPYYLGQIYGEGGVYPYWVDALHKIYPNPIYSPYEEVCITGAIGVGKELSPNTLVVCKRGSVRACEVTMQDEVLGTDGKFHAILGIFPQEPHRFWTFTFNDGSTTTTGEDHIWTVSKYGPRSPHQRWFDTTTRDIVTGKVHGRYTGSGKYGSLYLPVLGAPVDYGDATCRSLPIPPYALGLLIADGCLTTGDVRLSNVEEDVQQRYLQALSAFGRELHYLGHNMYNTVPGGKIKAALNKMGLLHRAEEKHIPEEYLRASVEDRLALLQGYFDGDGCIEGPAKTIPTMTTTSKRLSDDLTQLVCSLGGRVTVSKRGGKYKLGGEWHECQDVYYLVITMPRGVRCFSSVKHASRWHKPQNEVYKKIVRWEDAGIQQGVCFYVDTPNHLFAVDRYTFTHNTTVSLIGALYDLYHVTLLKDPHKKYKLLPTTSIIFSLVTATMDLATAVMANQFLDAMGASPYFCSKFNPKKGERLDEDMFAHHVGIGFGSRGGHNLGKAVIGAIIDEANFQDKVAGQAVDNYNTITRRMKSRFMLKGGTLPCRRWVISSRTDSAAFLESHIDAVRGKSNIIIFEPAIWDVQKVKGIYCGQTFPVFTGTTAEQPRILRTDEEVDNCAGYVIHVPVEYRDEFEEDLPKSLQDLAGVATRSGVNLIYDVEKLEESLCLDNCMATDEPHITLKGQDQLIDYYKKPLPPGQYFVHLDGAKSGDRYGVAFSRVTEQISLTRTSAIDGTEYSKLSPKVETPLAFGIKALPGSQVPFFKVRQFLCDLRSRGVNIQYVSADGYQSVDMLQLLEKLGFKCGYESADRTKDPYLKLAENVVLGLHKMPKSIVLKNELLNLQNLPNKVDHPLVIMVDGKQTKGGKDIADACCVSAFCAIGASLTLTQVNMIEQMKSAPKQMSMKERQDFVLQNYFGFGT